MTTVENRYAAWLQDVEEQQQADRRSEAFWRTDGCVREKKSVRTLSGLRAQQRALKLSWGVESLRRRALDEDVEFSSVSVSRVGTVGTVSVIGEAPDPDRSAGAFGDWTPVRVTGWRSRVLPWLEAVVQPRPRKEGCEEPRKGVWNPCEKVKKDEDGVSADDQELEGKVCAV
ncbi:hypothetical protein ON010_g14605 [Phytophthora cinnamomi]|nr:hypothetical protein ON010_g14605 [Phytophthora cinnamomi]